MSAVYPIDIQFVKVIPAADGFYVLGVLSDDQGFPSEAIKYPVVAWALEKDTYAPYPVTLEGVQTDNCYILQPDGTVERPLCDGFASVAEWLAARRAAHASKAG